MRLQCPHPRHANRRRRNHYGGALAPAYLVGNNSLTWQAYELKVARLRLGVTAVRLRADVRRRAIRQPAHGRVWLRRRPLCLVRRLQLRDADAVYGESDLLTITDKPTDKAGGEQYGLKLYVDGLFSFSEGDPADDYSGEWTDDSTFVVQIIDPTDIVPSVACKNDALTYRQRSRSMPFSTRPSNCASQRGRARAARRAHPESRRLRRRVSSASVVVPVTGNFGVVVRRARQFHRARRGQRRPSLEGDELVLQFDVATDRGSAAHYYPHDPENSVERAEVDRLFAFSQPLGVDYSGLWTDTARWCDHHQHRRNAASASRPSRCVTFAAAYSSTPPETRPRSRAPPCSVAPLAHRTRRRSPVSSSRTSTTPTPSTARATRSSSSSTARPTSAVARPSAGPCGRPLRLSHALGSRYSSEWQDASSFVVTIVSATGEGVTTDGCAPRDQHRAAGARGGGEIRNRASVSGKSVQVSPALVPRGAGVGSLDTPILTCLSRPTPTAATARTAWATRSRSPSPLEQARTAAARPVARSSRWCLRSAPPTRARGSMARSLSSTSCRRPMRCRTTRAPTRPRPPTCPTRRSSATHSTAAPATTSQTSIASLS